MSKVIVAEYDAQHQTLKLREPLEGVQDRDQVHVAITEDGVESHRSWKVLKGCLPPQTIDEIRRSLTEASAPDPNEL